jgi:hypothetical protein
MHHADHRLPLPATFAGMGVLVRHAHGHHRPGSRDERLAIEAGAYADVEPRGTSNPIGWTHPNTMSRPRTTRGAIRS